MSELGLMSRLWFIIIGNKKGVFGFKWILRFEENLKVSGFSKKLSSSEN